VGWRDVVKIVTRGVCVLMEQSDKVWDKKRGKRMKWLKRVKREKGVESEGEERIDVEVDR